MELIWDTFKEKPLGCIAISQMLPKREDRFMGDFQKQILHEKFHVLKDLALRCKGYETRNIE